MNPTIMYSIPIFHPTTGVAVGTFVFNPYTIQAHSNSSLVITLTVLPTPIPIYHFPPPTPPTTEQAGNGNQDGDRDEAELETSHSEQESPTSDTSDTSDSAFFSALDETPDSSSPQTVAPPTPPPQPIQRSKSFLKNKDKHPIYCPFCQRNRMTRPQAKFHDLKDDEGLVVCPNLQKEVCPKCGATGRTAHTIKYCPIFQALTTEECDVYCAQLRLDRAATKKKE